jgi:nucleoside-diphosphate-sugar epimerase
MKKAIITGANGLVGMAVAEYFTSLGIEVLCLGRKTLSLNEIKNRFGVGSSYLMLEMKNIDLLADRVRSISWLPGAECVFFNFAWCGSQRLTDGSFGEQLSNAIHAAAAVRAAKKLGCIKFVNVGTLEETFVEQSIEQNSKNSYQSTQLNYALAKLASRNMSKMVAYLEKIDYIHTRLSIPLAIDLSQGSYVAATLKKIIEGNTYERPTNKQLFDIIFTKDVAIAFHLIGISGKNKADYFIGTSRLITLRQHFEIFERLMSNNCPDDEDIPMPASAVSFDTNELYRDTGFVATTRFQDMIRNLVGV